MRWLRLPRLPRHGMHEIGAGVGLAGHSHPRFGCGFFLEIVLHLPAALGRRGGGEVAAGRSKERLERRYCRPTPLVRAVGSHEATAAVSSPQTNRRSPCLLVNGNAMASGKGEEKKETKVNLMFRRQHGDQVRGSSSWLDGCS